MSSNQISQLGDGLSGRAFADIFSRLILESQVPAMPRLLALGDRHAFFLHLFISVQVSVVLAVCSDFNSLSKSGISQFCHQPQRVLVLVLTALQDDWQHSLHSRRSCECSENFSSSSRSGRNSLSLSFPFDFWHSFHPHRVISG